MKEREDRSQADDTCRQVCGRRRTALSTLLPPVSTMGRYLPRGLGIVLAILMLGGLASTPLRAQDAPAPATPAVIKPGPGAPQHESVLSPIPEQFDWIRRDVRPNTLLESLLPAQAGPPRLLISVSLSEQYSDNFEQEEDDPQEEFRTILSLGTTYRVQTARAFVSLANTVSGNYDALDEDYNVAFANLALNAGYDASQWSLALSESFIRDDEFSRSDTSGVRRGRRAFLQNRVSPQIRYAFGPLTSMALAYTNVFIMNDGRDTDDSLTHIANANFTHRFSRRVSTNMAYIFTTSDGENSTDTISHQGLADISYLFTSHTSLSFQTSGSVINRRNGGADATTYGGNLGLTHQFGKNWRLFTALGATVIDQAGNNQQTFLSWQGTLNGVLSAQGPRQTTLTINAQQRVADTVGNIDSVGVVRTTSASVSLAHDLSRVVHTVFFGNFSQTEQLENVETSESEDNRADLAWSAGARLTYAFAPSWALSLDYRHSERLSDSSGGDFDENRAILSVSVSF